MSAPARYAVFGHPVAHSRSPWIHMRFAQASGIALSYAAIDAPPEHFLEALLDFAQGGGRGANITLPLKELAATCCDQLSEHAARAGAVNTLMALPGKRWRGDNTDGLGLIADFARLGVRVSDRRVLILGAGGAVRGILAPLLAAGPQTLVIANRTAERAARLAAEFGALGPISAVALDALAALGRFDLVIHASSAYRDGSATILPASNAGGETQVYDLSYGAAAQAFLEGARALGVRHAFDGLGMLVEQAAESFERWHGQRPETAAVHRDLRALMDAA